MTPTFPTSIALAYASASLCAIIFIPLSFAADQSIECPAAISATSIKVTNIVDGWTPTVPSSLALTAAGFMQASPEKMAHLKPAAVNAKDDGTIGVQPSTIFVTLIDVADIAAGHSMF